MAFVVPIVNYQWPSLPHDLIDDDKRKKDYWWMMCLARYVPRSLLHWWAIRKSSTPSSTNDDSRHSYYTTKDLELSKNAPGFETFSMVKLINSISQLSQCFAYTLLLCFKLLFSLLLKFMCNMCIIDV